jgi:hypothetical protein
MKVQCRFTQNSKKHSESLSKKNLGKQTFFDFSTDGYTRLIVEAFASADIPLKKLENKAIKNMFKI